MFRGREFEGLFSVLSFAEVSAAIAALRPGEWGRPMKGPNGYIARVHLDWDCVYWVMDGVEEWRANRGYEAQHRVIEETARRVGLIR